MRNCLLWIGLACASLPVKLLGQWVQIPAAAVQAQGGILAVQADSFGTVWTNPASLSRRSGHAAHLGLTQPSGIPAFRTNGAGLSIALPDGQGAGIALTNFGFAGYTETIVGLAYGRRMGNAWQVGVRGHGLWVQVPEFGATQRLWVDAGLQYTPDSNWQIGLLVINAQRVRLNAGTRPLPGLLEAGARYRFSQQVATLVSYSQRLDQQLGSVNAGIDYHPTSSIQAQVGFRSAPWQISLGGGWLWRQLQSSFVMTYESALGFRPTLNLDYTFSRFTP